MKENLTGGVIRVIREAIDAHDEHAKWGKPGNQVSTS